MFRHAIAFAAFFSTAAFAEDSPAVHDVAAESTPVDRDESQPSLAAPPAHDIAAVVLALHDLRHLDDARWLGGTWLKGDDTKAFLRVHPDGEQIVAKIEVSRRVEAKLWKLARKLGDEALREGEITDFDAVFSDFLDNYLSVRPPEVPESVFAIAEPWLSSRTLDQIIIEFGVLEPTDSTPLLVIDRTGVIGGVVLGSD